MATKQAKRNRFACDPILRKGGVHQTSKSGARNKAKQETRRLAKGWQDGPHPLFLVA